MRNLDQLVWDIMAGLTVTTADLTAAERVKFFETLSCFCADRFESARREQARSVSKLSSCI